MYENMCPICDMSKIPEYILCHRCLREDRGWIINQLISKVNTLRVENKYLEMRAHPLLNEDH